MKNAAAAVLALWLVLSALYGGSQPSLGGDLWWSLAAGRHISAVGAVPDVDVFSHAAAGEPWANQEWLFQVLSFQIFDTLGPDGLVVVKLALTVVFALLLAWLCAKRSESWFLAVAITSSVLLVWGSNIDMRAQFFTFLGSVLLLLSLDAYRRGSRGAALGPPLLLLLWVDLHYGFIFGLAVVFGYFCAETTKSLFRLPADPLPIERSRRLGWVFVASVVACTLNPQGIDALVFPFDILDSDSPWNRVVEWLPPRMLRRGKPDPFLIAVVIQSVIAAMALWRVPRRFDLTDFGLVVVTGVMASTSRRFVPLFAIVGAPFLARNLGTLARDVAARKSAVWQLYHQRGVQSAFVVGLAGSLAVGAVLVPHLRALATDGLFRRMTHAERFPTDATRFLQENPVAGNLYNFYPWGGYLLFHLDRQIFIDGRAHAVYPDEIYHEAHRTDATKVGWRRTLNRRAIDVVVHQSNYPLPLKLRGNPNWIRVYDDGYASVLVRRTAHTEDFLDAFAAGNLWYPDSAGAALFQAELLDRAGQRDAAVDAMTAALETHGYAAEKAAVLKYEIETAAEEFSPDPKASGTANALAAALERYDRSQSTPASRSDDR